MTTKVNVINVECNRINGKRCGKAIKVEAKVKDKVLRHSKIMDRCLSAI